MLTYSDTPARPRVALSLVRLLFEQDRVVGVEYVPVPLEAPDVYCETILESCLSGQ